MYVTVCKSASKEMAKEAQTIWLKYCQWARGLWRTPNQAEESQLCHSAEILSVKISVGFQTTLKMMWTWACFLERLVAGSECHLCCVSGACYFYGFKLQGAVAFYFILVQNKHNSIKKKLHLNIDSKEKRTNRPALGSLPRDSQARWEMIDGTQEDLSAFCHISPFKIKIYRNELGTFFKKKIKSSCFQTG